MTLDTDSSHTRLMRLPEVLDRVGLGKTKVYALVKSGDFPAPVKVGRSSLWHTDEVFRWMGNLRQ